jgi:anti-sigma-K factor RskA
VSDLANSNSDGDWESELAEYSIGVMDTGAAVDFERRLNECRAHVALAQEYEQVVGLLGLAAGAAEPPAGHRERFAARLQAAEQQIGAGSAPPILGHATAPVPVAAAETARPVQETRTGAQAYSGDSAARGQMTDLGAYRERRSPRSSLVAMAAIAAALVLLVGAWGWTQQQQAQQFQRDLAEFQDPNRRVVIPASAVPFPVRSQDGSPDAWAVCFLDPQTDEMVLLAKKLPAPPAGMVYEAWWLPKDDSAPLPAGIFTPDSDGRAQHEIKSEQPLTNFKGIAVTVEPGLMPAATGKIVLVGTYEFD